MISTSQIEHLRLVLDKPDPVIEVNIPFDTIVGHLVNKHALTLRYLDLRSAYVSVEGVKTLFSGCLQLEVFYIAARESALVRKISSLQQPSFLMLFALRHRLGHLPRVFIRNETTPYGQLHHL